MLCQLPYNSHRQSLVMQCHASDLVQQKHSASLPLHLHPAYTSIPFYSAEGQAYKKQNHKQL